MSIPLEFMIHRLNELDDVTAECDVEEGKVISIGYKGTPVADVYASIAGEIPDDSKLMPGLMQVPRDVRIQIAFEILMYRLSIREEER